jgi:hypothetical protein
MRTEGGQPVRASKVVTAVAVAAITAGSASLSFVAQAKAATAGTPGAVRGTHAKVSPLHRSAHMGSYGASRFARPAAKLPAGLAGQLRKQLGITLEQFLADGQAAADAGAVIASLRADGATVFGAKLNGTALTLTVRDTADAAAAAPIASRRCARTYPVSRRSHPGRAPGPGATVMSAT